MESSCCAHVLWAYNCRQFLKSHLLSARRHMWAVEWLRRCKAAVHEVGWETKQKVWWRKEGIPDPSAANSATAQMKDCTAWTSLVKTRHTMLVFFSKWSQLLCFLFLLFSPLLLLSTLPLSLSPSLMHTLAHPPTHMHLPLSLWNQWDLIINCICQTV